MTLFKGKYRAPSARLPGWDYRTAGWYFITICTHNRTSHFGDVVDYQMQLSPVGQTAYQYLAEIPDHTSLAQVDAWVVMPNHVHVILVMVETLHCNVSTTQQRNVSTTDNTSTTMSSISPKAGSVSAIIRSYKAAVTKWCRQNGFIDFAWQTRFHDHVIRNQASLERIRAYVRNNPAQWQEDCYHK